MAGRKQCQGQLRHGRLASAPRQDGDNLRIGEHVWDVVYMSGWVPEFANFLTPFQSKLSKELIDDMPKTSFSTVTWNGETSGAVFTLSLLTMFYNTELLEKAGFKEPPKTWDELKAAAKECTRDGKLWLGAELWRAGGHRRHGILLDVLPATGGRKALQ